CVPDAAGISGAGQAAACCAGGDPALHATERRARELELVLFGLNRVVLLRRQEPRAIGKCGWALGSCLRRSTDSASYGQALGPEPGASGSPISSETSEHRTR